MTTPPDAPPPPPGSYPPPPPSGQPYYYPPPAPIVPRNGFGIAALVLALVGLVFGLVPFTGFLALILGMLAVLFGLLGCARVRKGIATNYGMSMSGGLLGLGAVILGIWGMTITFNAVDQLGRDLQDISRQSAPLPPSAATNDSNAAPLPTPGDFTLDVKVLEKQCFGSAGCNVVYQVVPKYTGAGSLDGQNFTVIYEVTGGEDGPQINNFKIRGDGNASVPEQEFVSTSSSGSALKAKATSVSEN